jgi:hypothetical protein
VARIGRREVGERAGRWSPHVSEGREKAPRTEGTNQRGKRILGNTAKVGLTGPAKGGGLWKRRAGIVKKGGEREAGGRLGRKGRMGSWADKKKE